MNTNGGVLAAREVVALGNHRTIGGVLQRGLTHQQLADIIGLSRDQANKVLDEFRDQCWAVVDCGILEGHATSMPMQTALLSNAARGTA